MLFGATKWDALPAPDSFQPSNPKQQKTRCRLLGTRFIALTAAMLETALEDRGQDFAVTKKTFGCLFDLVQIIWPFSKPSKHSIPKTIPTST